MRKTIIPILFVALIFSCKPAENKEKAKLEILNSEKAFEKMAREKGLAEAFYFYADENAAVKRGESLIVGRENIHDYYLKNANPNATLEWTPDLVAVSDCGTLGYTYGKYVYSVRDSAGNTRQSAGIFHTVWKKTPDGWRYVWD